MFYTKFKQRSTVRKDVLFLVEGAPESFWLSPALHLPQHLPLPIHLFEPDSDVVKLMRRFKSEQRAAAFRFQPHSTYDWHVDSNKRQASINILLNAHHDSWTLFGRHSKETQTHVDVEVLNYGVDCYYLLDLQTPHMVVNASDQVRYVVSIGFDYPFDLLRAASSMFERGIPPQKASEV